MSHKEKEDSNSNGGTMEQTLDHIVSDAYKSLDKQIDKLDQIPETVKNKTDVLLKQLFSDKDIFRETTEILQFIQNTSELSAEIGFALETLLEVELAKQRIHSEPQMMPMPQLANASASVEKPNPNILVTSQPPKGGGWADYLGVRRWASAIEKIYQSQGVIQQPQITTSRVMQVLDYGQELISEWNKSFDFYSKGQDHLNIFGDKDTYERQHKQLAMHFVKLCNIIKSFSTAIAEYRKERFGDRKVGVAGGAMWLEASRLGAAVPRPGSPVSIDRTGMTMRDRVE